MEMDKSVLEILKKDNFNLDNLAYLLEDIRDANDPLYEEIYDEFLKYTSTFEAVAEWILNYRPELVQDVVNLEVRDYVKGGNE